MFPSGTVTFLFTDIEGSTRRWESDPEAMRSALAVHDEVLAVGDRGAWRVGCSSTPVTGCARRSARPVPRSTPRWRRSRRWGCRCAWGSPPVRRSDRGERLLRSGVEPDGAGDGRRSRRPDPGGGVDGGGGGRASTWSIWASIGCATCPVSSTLFQVRADGLAGRVSAVADVGCGAGEPAGADDQFRGPRRRGEGAGRAGAGPSAGDPHRGGWGGQDPPGGAGRGRAGRRVPRRGVAGRVGPRRRPRRGA